MDLHRKFFLIHLTVLLFLVQQIKCLNEINTIIFLSGSSSSLEEENIENKNILTNFERIEELNYSTTTERIEPSKTAMDIITIVWYTSTFLALAAFFFLMACSDKRCGRQNNTNSIRNRNDSIQYPPSPAPSYREFAPPSYEDIMKQAIYVIPLDKDNNNIKITPIKDNYCIIEGQQQQQQSQQQITIPNQQQQQQQHNIETNTRLHIINEFSSIEQSKNG